MNKKGASEEILEHIPYIIITILVMTALYFLLSYYSQRTVDVIPIQANVFTYRMLYQQNGLSYTDNKTGRVYPGVIDGDKFNSSSIDSLIKYTYERQVMAKFEIYHIDSGGKISEAYYNKEWYDRLQPLAAAGIGGSSSARLFEKIIPIIYRKGGVDTPANLKISVIIPN